MRYHQRSALLFMAIAGLTLASNGCSRIPQLEGKVLRIPLKDAVRTSDPTNAYDVVSGEVINEIYEPLYHYNYFRDGAEIIPVLADGMPKVSPDGKTYTIKLKKGVRFQDDACFKASGGKGREVKAADFIHGWKRHANPANESQAFWIWDGKVAGINEFQKKFRLGKPAHEVMEEVVEGFTALDDHTIRIQLTRPYPQLMYVLSIHFSAPIPHEAIETYGKDFVNHPVGTGPFKAKSWDPTSRMILVKNENFREELFPSRAELGPRHAHLAKHSGKRLPLADAIDFTVVKEEQPRWLGFLKGRYDQIQIPKDNFTAAIQNRTEVTPELKAKGITVSIEPAYSFWYVSFNVKDPVVGPNRLLRQAIASAVDAKGWLEMFKNGRGSIQNEVSPPAIKDRCGSSYRWTYDLDRARQLLTKAGYPDGKGLPVLKWDTRGTLQSERQLAEFIARDLAKIGIRMETVMNNFPTYLDKQNKGNLQISKGGWSMDYPDAENNMQLLYGPNRAPGPNETFWDNPDYNKLYDRMMAMPSGPERKKIICQMEKLIQEDVPWAYGIFEDEYRLVQPWAATYHTAELVMNKYKYVDVDEGVKGAVTAAK